MAVFFRMLLNLNEQQANHRKNYRFSTM